MSWDRGSRPSLLSESLVRVHISKNLVRQSQLFVFHKSYLSLSFKSLVLFSRRSLFFKSLVEVSRPSRFRQVDDAVRALYGGKLRLDPDPSFQYNL